MTHKIIFPHNFDNLTDDEKWKVVKDALALLIDEVYGDHGSAKKHAKDILKTRLRAEEIDDGQGS